MRKTTLSLILSIIICLHPAASRGQDVASEADLLFRRGGAAFKSARYEDALLAFMASNRLVRNRNALYNIALCFLKLGNPSDAYRYFTEYQGEALSAPEKEQVARELGRLRDKVALVSVTSEPAGALVYFDRRDLGARGSTPGVFALPPGRHVVHVERAGYHAEKRAVELAVGRTVEVAVPLRLVLGSVAIRSRPPGAGIRVDRDHGPPAAVAPAVIKLRPGRHTIYLGMKGHRTVRTSVEVVARGTVQVEAGLQALPPRPARLVVSASRPDAVVLVDGQTAGGAPISLDLPPGRHRIELRAEDYAPFQREVMLAPGERRVVSATLAVASEAEVVAATKRLQALEEAPTSVTVLTGAEIRALGYRTLGEALRGVRGFFLSDDRQYQTVGVRGVSPPGDLNTRLLILSDGHSLNDMWTGAAFMGHDFAADLSDVERIEIVRGPGSALYGTGAFFGLVDVTTSSREERRVSVDLGAGSVGELLARGSASLDIRAARIRLSAGALYSPRGADFPDPTTGGTLTENDGETVASAAGRVSIGGLTLSGRFNHREKVIPTTAFGIEAGTGRAVVRDQRGFFEARFERPISPAIQLLARAYYDHTGYDGRWPYSRLADEDLTDDGGADWLGGEARVVARPRGWLAIVAGAEGLFAPSVSQSATSDTGEVLAAERSVGAGSGYALAELELPRELRLILGFRGDYSTTGGFSPSPGAAVVWRPYPRGVSKLLFGRAFRAPSVYELEYHDGGLSQVPSNSGLGPETIYTWQLEHTHALGSRLFATAGLYYNDVRGLINLGPAGASSVPCAAAGGCVQYQNIGRVGTLGAEVELRRTFGTKGSFSLAYTFQSSRDLEAGPFLGDGSVRIVNSPEHLAYARWVRPLLRRIVVLGAELIYGGPRVRRDGAETEHTLLANLTLSGEIEHGALRYAVSAYNLLDWRYGVPVGEEYLDAQQEVRQLGRTFMVTLGSSLF
jgi:outer membrane receptor protein involved in Fe transport